MQGVDSGWKEKDWFRWLCCVNGLLFVELKAEGGGGLFL